jgi:hypothetical protein
VAGCVRCLCDHQSLCANHSAWDTDNLLEGNLRYAHRHRFVLVSLFPRVHESPKIRLSENPVPSKTFRAPKRRLLLCQGEARAACCRVWKELDILESWYRSIRDDTPPGRFLSRNPASCQNHGRHLWSTPGPVVASLDFVSATVTSEMVTPKIERVVSRRVLQQALATT